MTRNALRAPPATTAAPVGITSYADVQPAVIQIEAKGTFRDPEVGYSDGSGRGSGFIISPGGLAVTNNHVVAGAATLEVYVGGDTENSYNATILGVSEGAPIAVEVLRWDTSEVLRGEINGDEPIEPSFSIEQEVGEDEGATPTEYEYASLTDDLGRIRVEVPTAWAEHDTSPATVEDGTEVPSIAAATSLAGFRDGWTEPGLLFAAMPADTDVDGLLAEYGFADDCTDGGVTDYSDAVFTGKYQLWLDYAGTSTDVVTLVALPSDGSYTALIQAQIISDADLAALDRAFATFNTAS